MIFFRQHWLLAVVVTVVLASTEILSSCFIAAFAPNVKSNLPIPVQRSSFSNCQFCSSSRSRVSLLATREHSADLAPAVTDDDDSSKQLLAAALDDDISAAQALLAKISSMREQQMSQEDINEFIDNLLAQGPDRSLPFWTRSKRLAKFSRRARLASLRRTLDLTTPPSSENSNEKEDNKESQQQRRRRAFASLLRSIGNGDVETDARPIIVEIEKKSKMDQVGGASDLRKRIPEGLETPEYEIIAQKGSVEIRRYKPYTVCTVSMNKPRPKDASKTDANIQQPEMSGASSFGALAGYLFGKNDQSTAMKMTTPVFQAPTGDDTEEMQMQFVLPSQHWNDESTAPKPLDGSGVNLRRQEEEIRAVAMFGGYASKKEVDRRRNELLTGIAQNPEWKAVTGKTTLAQYNDPFTVPWKRLNEISVVVEKRNK
jgi:hypothetical protein